MTLEVFSGHTIDTSLLQGGWVLDCGCRDFAFARAMTERGCKVVALDADPTVMDPKIENVSFVNQAIAAVGGHFTFSMNSNPEGRHLGARPGVPSVTVDAVTLPVIMENFSVRAWDAVKLDVEGAEYAILREWPGPVAKQISIEFHEHVKRRPAEVYDFIFRRLGQWYDVVQHQSEARHCAGYNYWDTLLRLRGV